MVIMAPLANQSLCSQIIYKKALNTRPTHFLYNNNNNGNSSNKYTLKFHLLKVNPTPFYYLFCRLSSQLSTRGGKLRRLLGEKSSMDAADVWWCKRDEKIRKMVQGLPAVPRVCGYINIQLMEDEVGGF